MLNFQQKEKILKKYFEILRKCSLFDGVEDQHLIAMLSCLGAKRAAFDKKYTIFAEGSNRLLAVAAVLFCDEQSFRLEYASC